MNARVVGIEKQHESLVEQVNEKIVLASQARSLVRFCLS